MNRLEEIQQAAYNNDRESSRENQQYFIEGAEWADENPRTDIIAVDSISYVRMILVSNFCKIAKKYHGCTIDDVPEMKEAFDIVNNFDNACETAGYKLNDDKGIYEFK